MSGPARATPTPAEVSAMTANKALDPEADILGAARDWQDSGRGVAICTVVNTWGSSVAGTVSFRAG